MLRITEVMSFGKKRSWSPAGSICFAFDGMIYIGLCVSGITWSPRVVLRSLIRNWLDKLQSELVTSLKTSMVMIWIVFFKSGTGLEVRGWVWEKNSLPSLSMCFEWRRLRLEIWHHMVPWALLGVNVVIPPNTSECSPQSKKQTKRH